MKNLIIFYEFDLSDKASSDKYYSMFKRLRESGYIVVNRWEHDAPRTVSQVWPMADYYLTESGAQVWPWVEFHRERRPKHTRRGYYLEGVAPLHPAKVDPPATPRPVLHRKGEDIREPGRAAQAARWFFEHSKASRKDAAARFGVTVAAVGVCINRMFPSGMIPRRRPGIADGADIAPRKGNRGGMAARWLLKHPDFTRYDAARLFRISYTRICQAVREAGYDIPPAHKHGPDRTAAQIEEARRVHRLP